MKNRFNLYLICIILVFVVIFSGCVQSSQPIQTDSDGDGWTDGQESNAGTNPYNKDTDGDGYWDSKDENPHDKNIPLSQATTPSPITYYTPKQPTYQPTPYPTPYYTTTKQTQSLTSVIGKAFIVSGSKDGLNSDSANLEFGTDYIMWGADFGKAKITEERTTNSLIVRALIEEGDKQATWIYRFKDDGTVIMNVETPDGKSGSFYSWYWRIKSN